MQLVFNHLNYGIAQNKNNLINAERIAALLKKESQDNANIAQGVKDYETIMVRHPEKATGRF